jgi:hypothetical protein
LQRRLDGARANIAHINNRQVTDLEVPHLFRTGPPK